MDRTLRTWTTAFLLITLPFLALSPAFAGEFRVTRVVDGDTIKVRDNSQEATIRLVGIDAPEVSQKKREAGQPYSQQATKYLALLALNKVVDIKDYGMDRYNRILGVIFVDGKNINLEMVKAGFAEVYRGQHARGFDPTPYLKAENEAREARRGMWTLGEKYVSPREWRKTGG
jgi:micrococcal nuclease